MNEALIIVDMQADFLPGGALGIDGGDAIVTDIVELAKDIRDKGGVVIATRDYHPQNHISFKENPEFKDYSWPPHCVQGTPGVKLDKRIRGIYDYVVSKGYDADEEAYSAFQGTTLRPKMTLEELLKFHHIGIVYVVGLALEYCVLYTALDASALGYQTHILADLTESVRDDSFNDVIGICEKAGVKVEYTA